MMDLVNAALGLVAIVAGLLIAYCVGRRVERQRCVNIATMFFDERGAYIAQAIDSELLP